MMKLEQKFIIMKAIDSFYYRNGSGGGQINKLRKSIVKKLVFQVGLVQHIKQSKMYDNQFKLFSDIHQCDCSTTNSCSRTTTTVCKSWLQLIWKNKI